MFPMAAEAFIQCRVPQATKAALRAAAERQQLTESALLKRMLELVLPTASGTSAGEAMAAGRPTRESRLYVRLTAADRQLLQARSAARLLAPATYTSLLLRAHLRGLTPLPQAELSAIRQSTSELAAIGRHLNQIAHATYRSGSGGGVSRGDLLAFVKVCEALRDHVRAYISTNLASWGSSDAT